MSSFYDQYLRIRKTFVINSQITCYIMTAQLTAAKFVQSEKNAKFLVDENNYEYKISSKIGENTFWKCRRTVSEKCRARAITCTLVDGEYLKKVSGEHTHSSKLMKRRISAVESLYVQNAARNLTIPCRTILGEITNHLQTESLAAATSKAIFFFVNNKDV